jgi:glycine hydroxymethyltransferase
MKDDLAKTDQKVLQLIKEEEKRQAEGLEMIPSENYTSRAVMEAMGSVFTDKYSEGYPRKRYYGGNEAVDKVEELAQKRALQLFKLKPSAWHVNVQPYSGSPANMAVYFGLLSPNETIMGMRLSDGGHLTHGHPKVTFSGTTYHSVQYGVGKDGWIDYDEVERLALKHKPKIIISGYTAYPRKIDFKRFGEIAKKVGALHMVDMAHIAGLIAGGAHPTPFPYADIVTTTTHKTLRGPRGAMIFCRHRFAEAIDKAVFPGLQGGPHDHQTAAIAVALKEASLKNFKKYVQQIVKNCQVLADELIKKGNVLSSGGTDNHLILVDLRNRGIGGKEAQEALEQAGIYVNKNTIPFDPNPPWRPSGIRLGTPALTSRGMKGPQMIKIAGWIDSVLREPANRKRIKSIRMQVKKLCQNFPVPGI